MVIGVSVISIFLFAATIFNLADGNRRAALLFSIALVFLLGGYVVMRNLAEFKVVEERQEVQEIMTGDGGTVQVVFFKSQKDSNSWKKFVTLFLAGHEGL